MGDRSIIRGRWVLAGGGDSSNLLTDAAVVIEGDTILELGDRRDILTRYPEVRQLGGDEVAILPGLINAHHHSHGATTIQHGMPDRLLEPWILSFRGARGSDIYLNTLLSSARELASGVTTVVDVHSGSGTARDYEESVDRGLRAYEEAGIRVAFATGVSTQSFLVHGRGEDRRFIDALPAALRGRAKRLLPGPDRVSADEYLDVVTAKAYAYEAHPRIDVWFAPPGPQWVSDELLGQIAEHAASLDTGVQTHCVESIYEMLHGPRFYRRPTVLHLRELGILSPRWSLAHGVWLKEAEIEALAESGAAVSHNPSSNLRLRAGIAPLNALLEAGVTVGLGMDGTSLNEDEDMFTEMRLAMRLHRSPRLDAPAPSPRRVLAMATGGGAKLLGRERDLGQIAPGCKADLVLVDLRRLSWPWTAPEADPLDVLLMRARAGDVHSVLVGGEVVFEDGRPTRFDLEAVAAELAKSLARADSMADSAALVAELTPHLESWYKAWEVPPLDPYVHYNSRR